MPSVNTQGLFQLSETARGLSECVCVCVCCSIQWSVARSLPGRTRTEGSIVITASWGTIPPLIVFVVYNRFSQMAKYTDKQMRSMTVLTENLMFNFTEIQQILYIM